MLTSHERDDDMLIIPLPLNHLKGFSFEMSVDSRVVDHADGAAWVFRVDSGAGAADVLGAAGAGWRDSRGDFSFLTLTSL